MDRRISMEAVTEKAERCLPEEIIDAALKLLRSDLEIRQQFMSFRNDDAARRNIMYELSNRYLCDVNLGICACVVNLSGCWCSCVML